ncbi:Uncharacterised protein [Bordetella pertussis]|nr:Uncharacterised protein [Bordetella pertussis]
MSASRGCPRLARCTRIWWVRPVSSRHSTSLTRAPPSAQPRRRGSKCVTAGLGAMGRSTLIRTGTRASRPMGRSTVPAAPSQPCASAMYWRPMVRACSWRTRWVWARSLRATTIRPDVSLSSRCTMPARATRASSG